MRVECHVFRSCCHPTVVASVHVHGAVTRRLEDSIDRALDDKHTLYLDDAARDALDGVISRGLKGS